MALLRLILKMKSEQDYNSIFNNYLNGNFDEVIKEYKGMMAGEQENFISWIVNELDIPEVTKIKLLAFLLNRVS